ncbi:MAG: hypothetical protein WCF78_01550, partial [archaeon]
MVKNKKGFIGAIGDDLPSLIPIFLGLIIFFAVFLSTYNTYKTSTGLYSLEQEAISISMILKSEPLIPDYNLFMKTCNKVSTNKKWNAFIIDLDLNTDNQNTLNISRPDIIYTEQIKTFTETPPAINPKKYICDDNQENLEDLLNISDSTTKKITYLYPITLQDGIY